MEIHTIGFTKKSARQFFEALIVEDYTRAGRLYSGMPAAKMAEVFGKFKFLRIVSIGQPRPHRDPATGFLQVPCQVEIEADGERSIITPTANVRRVIGQPGRWAIGGGI